jgi:hypothetical protein
MEEEMRIVQVWTTLAGLALLLAAIGFVSPSAAEEQPPGYWSCNGTEWVAVGAPEHPLPLIQCGGTVVVGEPADTQERCEAQGGIWGPIGLYPEPVCTLLTIDAGRYCADMGECAASCDAILTDEQYQAMMDGEIVLTGGQCSPAVPLIGCHAMVHAGEVDGMLCID